MKPLLIIFTLLLSCQFAWSQNPQIITIRKLYNEFQNNKSSSTQNKIDDFENSSEGGEITAYYINDSIKMIETKYYGHMGKTYEEYYFDRGKLYFVFSQDFQYNAPPTEEEYKDNETVVSANRKYFWNQDLIRWIGPDGTELDSSSTEYMAEESFLVKYANSLLKKF
uniref:hypothetical protein n=1 Tax=Fulvivirga sp. TaxID=1931237 RepID=UPI00404A5382